MLRLAAALLSVCVFTTNSPPPQPITVSAAISLTEVLQELGRMYEAQEGGAIVLNFGSSNVLARQIVNGAPVDLFISADENQMALVEKAGLIAAGSRVPLVGNQLALIVRADRADPPASVASLASADIRRVAIGNPDAVPAGVYAKRYLERVKVWKALRGKLLPTGSVRAVLAAVANGAADAGIVYVTDVKASDVVRITAVLPDPGGSRIVYPAAVIASSPKKDAAQAFLRFLQSPVANAVFTHYGFQPLGSGP